MKALCWYGKGDLRVETVLDAHIISPRNAIIKVTAAGICGSDLHIYDGYVPTMQQGDIPGHEFMGEAVEVGSEVRDSGGVGLWTGRATGPRVCQPDGCPTGHRHRSGT